MPSTALRLKGCCGTQNTRALSLIPVPAALRCAVITLTIPATDALHTNFLRDSESDVKPTHPKRPSIDPPAAHTGISSAPSSRGKSKPSRKRRNLLRFQGETTGKRKSLSAVPKAVARKALRCSSSTPV
ncbi:hypothetical protein MHYP_G00338550 [Metynnis hypsauchen]